MSTVQYAASLPEALEIVARASIDDTLTVSAVVESRGTRYLIETTAGYDSDIPETFDWSYDEGIEAPPTAREIEIARVFHESEFWDTAGHVRHNLPNAVEALLAGRAVTFGYRAVEDWQESEDAGRGIDPLVGWTCAATWHYNEDMSTGE